MANPFIRFNCLSLDVGRKVHNLNADTLKVMLTNTLPNVSTNTVKTDISEISAGNGYIAGGHAITANSFTQSGSTAILFGTGPTITASGGSIGPFRYAVVYNDTASGDNLIGYTDYTSSITLTSGQSFGYTIDPTNGLFKIG